MATHEALEDLNVQMVTENNTTAPLEWMSLTTDEKHLFLRTTKGLLVQKDHTLKRTDSDFVLAEAMAELALPARSPKLCIGWNPAKPFSDMAHLLEMVRTSAHKLEHGLNAMVVRRLLGGWFAQTKASRPSRVYDLALEAFDKFDDHLMGQLGATEAQLASENLHASLDVEDAVMGTFKEGEKYGFESWMSHVISKQSLPRQASAKLEHAETGLRCICGLWMEQKVCSDCYINDQAPAGGTGRVRCDFSGRTVTGNMTWHCPKAKEAVHPYGYDVDVDKTDQAKAFQLQLRLEQRMNAKLDGDCGDEERLLITRRRNELLQSMFEATRVAYHNASEDLSRAKQSEPENAVKPELQNRLDRMRELLVQSEVNWNARYSACLASGEAILTTLNEEVAMLSHDAVRFKNEEDKKKQIDALEKEFDGAKLHKHFGDALEALKQEGELCKEFVGLEEVDLQAEENKGPINQISQGMLNAMIQAMPPMLQAQVQQAEVEVESTTAGLQVKCKLTVAGQTVGLEQTVPYDNKDVIHSNLARKYGEKYHEIKERLASLAKCSTASELESCVECFECNGDEGICVVCQEDLCNSSKGTRLNACGHVFHSECIEGWLMGCKRECPICSAPLGLTARPSKTKFEVEAQTEGYGPTVVTTLEATADGQSMVGMMVQIVGLRARPELNGRVGVVSAYFGEERNRYEVTISDEPDGVRIAVKPQNLKRIGEVEVESDEITVLQGQYDDELAAALALSLEGCWTPGCHQNEGLQRLEGLQSAVLGGLRARAADAATELPQSAQTAQLNAVEGMAVGMYAMFAQMFQ